MLETYRRTRNVVSLAAVAVLLASIVVCAAFYRHITGPCRGALEAVPITQLPPPTQRRDIAGSDGVYLDFDRVDGKYENVRLWLATEECACKRELSVPWNPEKDPLRYGNPLGLGVYRNVETGLYVVHEVRGPDVFAFRRTSATGHVFKWRQALQTNNVSMLILLGAMGSLVGAALLLGRAGSYVTVMSAWRPARRREDGLLEDENGAAIARLGRVPFRETDVLVNPKCLEGRAVYRELPFLERRDVAPGSHARWTIGTFRRLRDARVLAVLATLTTAASVGAHLYAL